MLERFLAILLLVLGGLGAYGAESSPAWAACGPAEASEPQPVAGAESGAEWSPPAPDEAPPEPPAPLGDRGSAEPSEEQPSSSDGPDDAESDVEARRSGTPSLPARRTQRLKSAYGELLGGRTPASDLFRPPRA
jgi:hypothetical protein